MVRADVVRTKVPSVSSIYDCVSTETGQKRRQGDFQRSCVRIQSGTVEHHTP